MILFLILIFYFIISVSVPCYGDVLGYTKEGVAVFSNYKKEGKQRSYAGEKWECVEFVRRFLMITRGITFNEIEHAYDIFNLPYFQTLDGRKIPIVIIRNDGKNKPQTGDILVWSKDIHGHLAVIVDTKENGDLLIAEQNLDNKKWGDRHYSRVIRMESEPGLFGWIKV